MSIKIEKLLTKDLRITCIPLYNTALSTYNLNLLDKSTDDLTPKLNIWVFVQCSVDLDTSFMFLNGVTTEIRLKGVNKIDPTLKETKFIIKPGDNSISNYGFLFLREFKLYGKYNIWDFNTRCS